MYLGRLKEGIEMNKRRIYLDNEKVYYNGKDIKKFLLIVKKYRNLICMMDVDEYVGVEEDRISFDSLVGWMIYCYMEDGWFIDKYVDLKGYEWKVIGNIIDLFGIELEVNGFINMGVE